MNRGHIRCHILGAIVFSCIRVKGSLHTARVYVTAQARGPHEMFSIPRKGSSLAFNLRLAICPPVATRSNTNSRYPGTTSYHKRGICP